MFSLEPEPVGCASVACGTLKWSDCNPKAVHGYVDVHVHVNVAVDGLWEKFGCDKGFDVPTTTKPPALLEDT
jgi:hypothetical protein